MKIFTYTMVWDTGFAPAVHNGLLSLACCETKLRYLIAKEMARDNSSEIILLGLCGKQLASRHTLPNPYYPVYVSKITDFVKCSDYYTLPQYSSRPGCQYEKTGGIWHSKSTNPHKCDAQLMSKDLYYRGKDENYVLLSDRYVYFGADQSKALPLCFDAINEQRKRACRVSGEARLSEDQKNELRSFVDSNSKVAPASISKLTIDNYFLNGTKGCGK